LRAILFIEKIPHLIASFLQKKGKMSLCKLVY
jgi:hypothetical protein